MFAVLQLIKLNVCFLHIELKLNMQFGFGYGYNEGLF